MYAGFGTQPAIGVVALDVNGGALDARHFTFHQLDNLGLEATALSPAQVHTQQHIGPVLGFGATGTSLDIEVGVVGVHFTGEHAAEFELFELFIKALKIGLDLGNGAFVLFFCGNIQQAFGVFQAGGEVIDGLDYQLKIRALFAQRLRPLGVVPDAWLLQFALNFDQSLTTLIVVKDTP